MKSLLSKIGVFVLPILFAGTATGEVVVANNPLSSTIGGQADAYSSNGSYNNGYGVAGAQSFNTEDSFALTSLEWWGASYWGYIGDAPGLSNIAGFEIIVWNSDFSQRVIEKNVALANLTITNTGEENFYGDFIYKFRTDFAFNLGPGDYHMNIGANLVDGNSPYYWLWMQGQYSETGYSITTANNPQNPWGSWYLPQWIGSGPGGSFVLNAPSPGAVGLLALAGLFGSRRRR